MAESVTAERRVTEPVEVPPSCVVSGYEYRWFFGVAIPYVKFVDPVGDGAFPLIGHHNILLESRNRCISCMAESRERLCEECQQDPLRLRLRCILDGPGVPFDKECSPESPACGITSWARSVCYSEWMMYFASVFGVLKVGISRKARAGCDLGFTQRLLTQGAGPWVAVGPVNGLASALELEQLASDEVMISQRVTRDDRRLFAEALNPDDWALPLPLDDIRRFVERHDLRVFMRGDFLQEYLLPRSLPDRLALPRSPLELSGRVVFAMGPMIGFSKDDDCIEVHDLSETVGHGVMGWL